MDYSTILFETKDNFAVITLNRPDKLNALNGQLLSDLDSVLTQISLDESIRAVIITGSGPKAFAAGADIAELHEQDSLSGRLFAERGQAVFTKIERLGKPVIAAVNGFALGGGCELALACHIRFASSNAKFGQPEVNLGIIPGYGGTQRLTRLVGRAKSLELCLSGNMLSAAEAEKIGLVNSVHEAEQLMEFTENFVRTLAAKAPRALYATLEAVLATEEMSPLEGLHFEARKFGETCGTADFKEGTKAFLEKRQATFTGK